MTCPKCGEEGSWEARFCAYCGARLSELPVMRAPAEHHPPPERYSGKALASLALGAALALFALFAAMSQTWLDAVVALLPVALILGAVGVGIGVDGLLETLRSDATSRGSGVALGGLGLSALGGFSLLALFITYPARPSHQSRSINNLKQLALAVQQYSQDYGGSFPGWVRDAGGRAHHNVWDAQIAGYVRQADLFTNGRRGVRSPTDPKRQRILTYGLNGLLITPRKKTWDGNADWDHGPAPRRITSLRNPSSVILFAELATEQPMGAIYADPDAPANLPARPAAAPVPPAPPAPAAQPVIPGPPMAFLAPRGPNSPPFPIAPDDVPSALGEGEVVNLAEAWRSALVQWIDVDPRAWVETSGPVYSYDPNQWDTKRGVARDLYSGGAVFAFCDGHVRFMRLADTVDASERTSPTEYWNPDSPRNFWNPDHPSAPPPVPSR